MKGRLYRTAILLCITALLLLLVAQSQTLKADRYVWALQALELADPDVYKTPEPLTEAEQTELDTLIDEALAACTTPMMSQSSKLRAAFDYLSQNCVYLNMTTHYSHGTDDWGDQAGLWMLRYYKGNCYCYAGAFYQLARALGYDAQLVSGAMDLGDLGLEDHGWVMINGLIYDVGWYVYGVSVEDAGYPYVFPDGTSSPVAGYYGTS